MNNKVNAEANLHGQTDFHRRVNCLIGDTLKQTLSSKHESRFLVDLLINRKYLLPLQRFASCCISSTENMSVN